MSHLFIQERLGPLGDNSTCSNYWSHVKSCVTLCKFGANFKQINDGSSTKDNLDLSWGLSKPKNYLDYLKCNDM